MGGRAVGCIQGVFASEAGLDALLECFLVYFYYLYIFHKGFLINVQSITCTAMMLLVECHGIAVN